jgi:hypothetical protein
MKRLLLVLLLLAVVVPLQAQVRWGVRAGITEGDPMIGAELVMPIVGDLVVNPNIEFATDVFSANADVHYDFDISSDTSFWIGAGLAFINSDEGDEDYAGGVNLLGGIGTRRRRMYPYAQLKFTSTSDIGDFTSVALGVRF